MGVVASAPAKVILFGEHFVVYGEPSIVLAIDRRAQVAVDLREDKRVCVRSTDLNCAGFYEKGVFKVEQGDAKDTKMRFDAIRLAVDKVMGMHGEDVGLNVEINSAVPVAAGLGSSAAVIAAATIAVSCLLSVKVSKEDVFRITCETERLVHGTTSGVDPAISTFGGALLFQMDTGFKPLEVKTDIPLVVGDTGVQRSTRVQVDKVRNVMDNYPNLFKPLRQVAREIVLRAIDAFKENDLVTLGELMNINQGLLYSVGVSDESLEWLINASRKAGALGAKLTGAGGGGCMVALAGNERLQQVLEAIRNAGGRPFIARKTDEGVRVERT
jgi:mevalonate kinase